MGDERVNIKVVVEAGLSITEAIKAAVPGSLADFAARHDFHSSHVSMCIHGRRLHERIREALADELGVEREWLDDRLDTLMDNRRADTPEPAAEVS